MYYVVNIDTPTLALRVIRNRRVADVVAGSMNAYEQKEQYRVTEGPIEKIINREVSDFTPAELVFSRLS